ncbi:MAG: molybdenum cofactor biosynthesis protein MoaE, partial [Chloroflexi bacterium]|nr:molybdenum cofactor biosynthesis protein MoaE [Chloroflexota bacterium]
EAYPEMAEAMLGQLGDEIQARWPQIEAVSIAPRAGRLAVGEVSSERKLAGETSCWIYPSRCSRSSAWPCCSIT